MRVPGRCKRAPDALAVMHSPPQGVCGTHVCHRAKVGRALRCASGLSATGGNCCSCARWMMHGCAVAAAGLKGAVTKMLLSHLSSLSAAGPFGGPQSCPDAPNLRKAGDAGDAKACNQALAAAVHARRLARLEGPPARSSPRPRHALPWLAVCLWVCLSRHLQFWYWSEGRDGAPRGASGYEQRRAGQGVGKEGGNDESQCFKLEGVQRLSERRACEIQSAAAGLPPRSRAGGAAAGSQPQEQRGLSSRGWGECLLRWAAAAAGGGAGRVSWGSGRVYDLRGKI